MTKRVSPLRLTKRVSPLRKKIEDGNGLNVEEANLEFEQGLVELVKWAKGRLTK